MVSSILPGWDTGSNNPGAYMERSAGKVFCELVGDVPVAIASIIFTLVVTVILLKVDFSRLWRKGNREGNLTALDSRAIS